MAALSEKEAVQVDYLLGSVTEVVLCDLGEEIHFLLLVVRVSVEFGGLFLDELDVFIVRVDFEFAFVQTLDDVVTVV